jgi:hypothetical protein
MGGKGGLPAMVSPTQVCHIPDRGIGYRPRVLYRDSTEVARRCRRGIGRGLSIAPYRRSAVGHTEVPIRGAVPLLPVPLGSPRRITLIYIFQRADGFVLGGRVTGRRWLLARASTPP